MEYSFKGLKINTSLRQIDFDGKVVDCDDKQQILIESLINSYPKSCSKIELTNLVWYNTNVSNWSISKLVSEPRKLLIQNNFQTQ